MKSFWYTLASTLFLSAVSEADPKPNIVFVMADDLGWSDVGYNGAEFYETPHIDRACAEGMKFNHAYSGGPNCLPTRACLISGMYTPRTQIWTPGGGSKGSLSAMKLDVPVRNGKRTPPFPSKLELEPSATSIAEVLKSAGYATARFGKWHVGSDTQGFDISDSNGKGGAPNNNFYGNVDVHEWLTDASCRFIEEHREEPFFLYLNHWDVHTPIRARKPVVDRYKQKLKDGDWKHSWNPTYAAMVEAVDDSVGKIQSTLDRLELSESTLFIFTSDNGGHAGATRNTPLRGAKGAFTEGGVRVPTFMKWPGVIEAGSVADTSITSVDFMPTFGELADAKLPDNQPVDGVSIVPLLKGDQIGERAIFWHYPLYLQGQGDGIIWPISGTDHLYWRAVPSGMIRRAQWKLIEFFEDGSIQLFNISKEPGEKRELSGDFPEIARQLHAELDAWQKETKAIIPTKLNPDFDPKAGLRSKKTPR